MSLQSHKSSQLGKPKHTKASKMRDSAIKQHQENILSSKNIRPFYKLRQFLKVPPSDYIHSAKRRQKTVRENPYEKPIMVGDSGHRIHNNLNYSSIRRLKSKNLKMNGLSNGVHGKTVHGTFPHLRTKSIDAYSINRYGLSIDNPSFENGANENINRSVKEPNLRNNDISRYGMPNGKKKNIENLGRNKRLLQDDYGRFDQQHPQMISEIKKYQSLPRLDNKHNLDSQDAPNNIEVLPEKDRKKMIAKYFEQKKSMETRSQYGSVK